MTPLDQTILDIRHGRPSEVWDDKNGAIIFAHYVAAKAGYCFAIEGRFGWHVSLQKPSLRYGKVIECREGREFIA